MSILALMAWLSGGRLSEWAAVIEADLADPDKAKHLSMQLDAESAWRQRVVTSKRPVVQLVDVLPADPGWQSVPLTEADAQAWQDYLRQQTGVRFEVVLSQESAVYAEVFEGSFRQLSGAVSVTGSSYRSSLVDPDWPVLYTFAARQDADGQRVLVSASGGRPDEWAMVGSAARPIRAANTWLYTHELLHALGIRHHLRHDIYSDPGNPVLATEAVVGSDCIMSAGYVGGVWDGTEEGRVDEEGRTAMLDAVCPLCRYLLNPQRRQERRYARWYLAEALWLEE